MRRKSPMLDASRLKKGPWTPDEDQKLIDYINKHGHGSWRALPKHAGLNRRGPSCRLRWINYLRPDIKRGNITDEEEQTIVNLHSVHGNKWSLIAQHLPGRTDNEIKNFWNSTRLKKKLLTKGINPVTHRPITDLNMAANQPQLLSVANIENFRAWDNSLRLQSDATQLAKLQLLNSILQALNISSIVVPSNMEAVNNLLSPNLRENSEFFKTNSQLQDCFTPEDVNHYILFDSPNLESQQQQSNANYHPMSDSKYCGDNGELGGSYATTSSDVLPALASGSPKRKLENQFESYSKSNCASTPSSSSSSSSSTSTTLEAWDSLKDNELSDFWREILERHRV